MVHVLGKMTGDPSVASCGEGVGIVSGRVLGDKAAERIHKNSSVLTSGPGTESFPGRRRKLADLHRL